LKRLEANKTAANWETRGFIRQNGCTPPHFYSSNPSIDIYVSLHITTTKLAIAEPETNPQAVSEARTPQMRSHGITGGGSRYEALNLDLSAGGTRGELGWLATSSFAARIVVCCLLLMERNHCSSWHTHTIASIPLRQETIIVCVTIA
jgi:hypothetical protein